jgi:hypothetical protein
MGLDLRAGTSKWYIVILEALLCGFRFPIAMASRGLATGLAAVLFSPRASSVADTVAVGGSTEQH